MTYSREVYAARIEDLAATADASITTAARCRIMSNAQAASPRAQQNEGASQAAAFSFLTSLATEVSSGVVNLPCFPDVVIRIRKALDDPEAKLSQTVQIISTEPRLAARLVQAANSAAFNPAGKSVTDLKAAVTRLGQRPVQSAVMAFAVQQLRLAPSLRDIAQPLNRLWEESVAVAAICQVIAKRTSLGPEEAFLTGLLHGIGRLYIMVRAAGQMKALATDQAFMDMLDSWHPGIGKAVLENWGFAEPVCDALGSQFDYEHGGEEIPLDLTDVLVAGLVLAMERREPEPRTIDIEGVAAFERLRITPEDCNNILQAAELQLESLHAALG
jgi:HD-like signal output (HDOD) protein